jgi:hypothetical protein
MHAQWGGGGNEWPFYAECPNVYLGPEDPTGFVRYPGACMPWLDLYHARQRKGVYLCPEDPQPRFGTWMFQLRPGADWGGSAWRWPDPEALGLPVGLTLAWVNFPFIPPGGTWQSPPVALRFHDGTWYAAAELYRRWYDRHFTIDHAGSWLDAEDAWQSTILSYPDDTIGYRFADIPRLARAAASAGIHVLQLDGWDAGGIDRAYPDYRPDPRLGTPAELEAALAECHALGVKVLLFSNLQVAHIDTEAYRRELHEYTCRDPRGDAGDTMGWEYNTLAGLAGGAHTRMRNCNPAHPAFAKLMLGAYEGIARLGADGTQVDKVGCGVTAGSGAPDHHRALRHLPRDLTGTQPVIDMFARHLALARVINPNYCLAAETHWDRLLPYVHATYARHWAEDAPQIVAATFPEFRQTCCVTGPSDFALVAKCLRHGHIINIEARCLHGSIDDVPLMCGFVRAALALRRALRHLLWDARLVDPHPTTLTADPAVKFSLHQSRARPREHALVLSHFAAEPQSAVVAFPQFPATHATIYTIRSQPQRTALPATLTVPPGDCLVVVPELPGAAGGPGGPGR